LTAKEKKHDTSNRNLKFNLTEGLVDGQVSLDDEHGRSGRLGLLEDVASPTVEDAVDAADGILGTLQHALRINYKNYKLKIIKIIKTKSLMKTL
jgi:hypothetical protein